MLAEARTSRSLSSRCCAASNVSGGSKGTLRKRPDTNLKLSISQGPHGMPSLYMPPCWEGLDVSDEIVPGLNGQLVQCMHGCEPNM